jgi:hypothetical protein
MAPTARTPRSKCGTRRMKNVQQTFCSTPITSRRWPTRGKKASWHRQDSTRTSIFGIWKDQGPQSVKCKVRAHTCQHSVKQLGRNLAAPACASLPLNFAAKFQSHATKCQYGGIIHSSQKLSAFASDHQANRMLIRRCVDTCWRVVQEVVWAPRQCLQLGDQLSGLHDLVWLYRTCVCERHRSYKVRTPSD